MSVIIRKVGGFETTQKVIELYNALCLKGLFATIDDPGTIDGTTDGKLQTGSAADFKVDGITATKAATDDLWDLTAEVDTVASEYRSYWLLLDSSGVASIAAGSIQSTEALAVANLPSLDNTKSVLGVYTAGPSTDFDGVAGLAAQGTIVDGVPDGTPYTVQGSDVVDLVPA